MQRISITNPQNIIDGTAKKYYFKLRNTGGPKGDKGEKGDTGATGPQGPQGDPCTVIVNSTATLEPGSNAYVTNTGSLSNAVLDFGIPKGDRGPQGAKGDKGDTGAQGETGPRGPQGERGTNATVSIGTTYTLNPGSQATVYNSGSDSNAVLNFGIPKGEKGATGPQGPTGPAGQNFAPTVVAELPATGDESKLYLTPKAHTTSTATGNPVTANVAEQAGKMESFQLDGDTFQQSYEGYNILPNNLQSQTLNGITFTRNNDGSISIKGTATARIEPKLWQSSDGGSLVFASGTNYFNTTSTTIYYYANAYYSILPNSASGAMPSDRACSYAYIRVENGETIDTTIYPQIIEGSTASDYEPFVGGQPSPNPSYPQDINVVTGTQTVSINGANYLIDLGSIELCKLGTYQDYIWKDGEDWKVHKAMKETTLDGSEAWYNAGGNAPFGLVIDGALITTSDANPPLVYCDKFYPVSQTASWSSYESLISTNNINSSTKTIRIRYTDIASLGDFKTWLGDNNTILYYVLATATDTVITDTALIAQLEAIRTASLENGTNTITNTATGSNLAGDMEIGYYGYNPTNRYDKWLWLDLNNNYEQIGS